MTQKRKLDNYDDDCDTESLSSFESAEDIVHSKSSSEDDSRRIRRQALMHVKFVEAQIRRYGGVWKFIEEGVNSSVICGA
ncbi:hypothetical protein TNCV_2237701 [Trichonephila clavipes]|nr:hypothetical protein TNCV_2237701 [Trichonephila clavipes]